MTTVFISYSQVSADQFIAAALTWFGDPDQTQGSPWEEGEQFPSSRVPLSRNRERG